MQPAVLSRDNKLIQIIMEPRYRWLRHLLLLLLLIVAYNSTLVTYMGSLSIVGNGILYISLFQLLMYIGVAYLNIYVLVPHMFIKKRYASYFLSLLGLLSLIFILIYSLEYFVHKWYHIEPGGLSYLNVKHSLVIYYISDVVVVGMCCTGTTITMLFRKWFTDGERRNELEAEGYRSQLLKIKNSINPEFLSGTLLKAANETVDRPANSAGILGRLSRFLRYRLYDSTRGSVMLNSETAFLDNYLSLVKDVRPGFDYALQRHGEPANIAVPPSVLINITDIILGEIMNDRPVDMSIDITTGSGKTLILDIRTISEGIHLSGEYISGTIDDLLRLTFSEGFNVSLEPAVGRIDISISLKPGKI